MSVNSSEHFSKNELECSYTRDCFMDSSFLDILEEVRGRYGKPMRLSSAYRSPDHPVEAKKEKPGMHTTGKAVDILLY